MFSRYKLTLSHVLFLFILQIFIVNFSDAEEVFGCEGFVKSDIDISKALVKVKLYTKYGSLKDETECSPTNGYYFLPMPDKGDYILKVDPPEGWIFDPMEVRFTFDEVSDPCSLKKDINFQFRGFSIQGKVLSEGYNTGPEGVTVSLFKDKQLTSETLTKSEGNFEFTSIGPGKYTVKASHPKWKLLKSESIVTINNGNGKLADGSLSVSGYDVSGSVITDGEPMAGVHFSLSSLNNAKAPLRSVKSDSEGKFAIYDLAPGRYRIEPKFLGQQEKLKFDFEPAAQDFEIVHSGVALPTVFQMKGFTVTGRVLSGVGGKGIPNAKVFLNREFKTLTDKTGSYQLNAIQSGKYTLQIESEKRRFSPMEVKATATNPNLPDAVASTFEICGRVLPPRLENGRLRTVSFASDPSFESPLETVEVDDSGLYCLYLNRGKYFASVVMEPEEKARGLQYAPIVRELSVSNEPINDGLDFSQLKARITGRVICKEKCKNVQVRLIPTFSGGSTLSALLDDATTYTFDDVVLGTYRTTVSREDWCWAGNGEHNNIEVSTAQVTVPDFQHIGYVITVKSSHDTRIEYGLSNAVAGKKAEQKEIKKGTSAFCVPQAGIYTITPVGCHLYQQPVSQTWNTNLLRNPVILINAIGHTMTGQVKSDSKIEDLKLNVETIGTSEPLTLGPLNGVQEGRSWVYKVSFTALEDQEYKVTPHSLWMLFKPEELTFRQITDCAADAFSIEAYKGYTISGEIRPPLSGVNITVVVEGEGDTVVGTTESNNKGHYHMGPLDPQKKYKVIAEKEGYVMTGPDSKNIISARQLSKVVVTVLDEKGQPLQGVLISLSGGSYRRNSQTGADGVLEFTSLTPGEYFMRPMLKEYQFNPSSQTFQVKESDTKKLTLNGVRVAVSAYGSVTLLGGDPEPGVLVEAIGIDQDNNKCSQLQEEGVTESNGHFRIRGLQPQCNYYVRVKPGSEVNKNIYRATPEKVFVQASKKDIENIHLIAFQPITKTDVVALIKPMGASAEHLRTVRARLSREESPDTAVHVVRLDSIVLNTNLKVNSDSYSSGVIVHFPPVAADGRGYFVQLESSLPSNTFNYESTSSYIKANESVRTVILTLAVSPRYMDQDMHSNSRLLLSCFVVVLIAYFYRNRLTAYFQNFNSDSLRRTFSPLREGFSVKPKPVDNTDSSSFGERASARERERAAFRERRDISPDESIGVIVKAVPGQRKVKPRKT